MLILDIETYKTDNQNLIDYIVAGKKRADYKEAALEKLAIFPHTGRIILVGMLTNVGLHEGKIWEQIVYPEGADVLDQNTLQQAFLGLDGQDEKTIVEKTWSIIAEELDNGGQIITYNGKSFDIPYLIRRGMILNVSLDIRREGSNVFYPYDLIKKYGSEGHLDLFERLNPNYGEFVSLDQWAYTMGITNDFGTKGSEVTGWFDAGKFDEIKQHCSEDLWKTFYVYERMKPWLQ